MSSTDTLAGTLCLVEALGATAFVARAVPQFSRVRRRGDFPAERMRLATMHMSAARGTLVATLSADVSDALRRVGATPSVAEKRRFTMASNDSGATS